MSESTDWVAIARARSLNIPDEAVAAIAPSLTALNAAFQPLLRKLPHTVEPAIILSETAVIGE